MLTSRSDLAACMLAQLEAPEWVHRNLAVTTSEGAPNVLQMIRGGR